MQVFGDATAPVDLEFPTSHDLQGFPLDKKIKLQTIFWKNNVALRAIKLKFTNGVESPLFQKDAIAHKESKGYALKSTDVDID